MNSKIPAIEGGLPVRPKEKFLVFGSPCIEEDEIAEVVSSLRTGWLGTGPKVKKFEESFRQYKGSHYAVALNSCTAALHLSLLATGVGPGDEVITTAMTFCATINAIIHSGAKPVLVDCDPKTMNIDPALIESKINHKTKAFLIVHFAGRPCAMDKILPIVKKHKLILIEDCAHAIESEYHGKKTGTFGHLGCFSFYVTKNITTGEGGMAITQNSAYAAKIKTLALHGMSKDAWKRFGDEGYKHYKVIECGFKYNMMDIQAAIGLHQFARLEKYWQIRQKIWNTYNVAFANLPIERPSNPEPDTKHAHHLYTIRINKENTGMTRDYFLNAMTKENIGVGVHYLSIPEHPYYQKTFGWKVRNFPQAHRLGQETVSLPISAKLNDDDVNDVIKAVYKIFGK